MAISKQYGFLILLAATLPTVALATQPGWYLAIDGGQSHYTGVGGSAQQWGLLTPSTVPEFAIVSATPASFRQKDVNDTGYRLSAGYQVNSYFGVEAGYVSFGNIRASGDGSLGYTAASGLLPFVGFGTFTDTAKLQSHGWVLAATGSWPINPQWSLFGRAGVFDSQTRLKLTSVPGDADFLVATSLTESDSSWSPTYGVGVNFSPADHWALRVGLDRYANLGDRKTTGRFSVNLTSLGVVYTL